MVGSAGLINHSEPLSASEVGLNIAPHRASSSTRPLVPVGSTNQDQKASTRQQLAGAEVFFERGWVLGG